MNKLFFHVCHDKLVPDGVAFSSPLSLSLSLSLCVCVYKRERV